MNKKIMGLAILAMSAIGAFAFKAAPVKTAAVQTFFLQVGGNPYNPLHYSTATPSCATGNATVCALDAIAASEIYTAAESIAKVGNTSYQNKPKVDISTQAIKTDIDDALLDGGNTWTPANGRVIVERP